jgi:hypothetical protein
MPANWDLMQSDSFQSLIKSDSCFNSELQKLESICAGVDLKLFAENKPATQQLREVFNKKSSENQWEERPVVTREFPNGVLGTNYEVDYQYTFKNDGCISNHQISIELAFDNRQAVGTNVLKMDLANKLFTTKRDCQSVSIIVVPSLTAKKNGHWDNSVATDYDYSWSLRNAYSDYAKSPILLLILS